MSQSAANTATVARPRWPYAGAGQKPLLLASVLMIVGSFLPWVMTPLGNLAGSSGPGLYTLYLACIGISGALVRRPRLALVQALLTGIGGAGIALWQIVVVVQLSIRTDAWGTLIPGVGLVFVLASGLLALVAARRLQRGE